MLVREAMNRNVICTSQEITLRDAARIMVDNGIGCIIVKKNNDVIGIITDRDVLVAFARGKENSIVDEIMTKYVIYVRPESTVEKAAEIMRDNKVKKLPVIDDDRLVGIITANDIAENAPDIIKGYKEILKKK